MFSRKEVLIGTAVHNQEHLLLAISTTLTLKRADATNPFENKLKQSFETFTLTYVLTDPLVIFRQRSCAADKASIVFPNSGLFLSSPHGL